MRKYNKYVAASLLLFLLSFSTYAIAEDNNFSTTAMLDYNSGENSFSTSTMTEENNDFPANEVSEYDSNDNEFSANAVKERDNDFCIKGDEWSSATFTKITKNDTDLYSVTSGQPFSGIDPKNQPSDKKCIRVRSGRQNSIEPMNWAYKKSVFSGGKKLFVQPILANWDYSCPTLGCPANFAFTGTLTLKNKDGNTFSCPDVVIGQAYFDQGSGIAANRWFIYSNYSSDKTILKCTNVFNEQGVVNLGSGASTRSATHNTFKIWVTKA